MEHKAENFDHLLGKLEGISEKQLKAHFGLYAGYVKKLNEIEQKLTSIKAEGNYSYSEFSELKRREAVAFNGTYLHKLYFENLEHKGTPSKELKSAIEKAFTNMESFEANLKASASSTPGLVVLTKNKIDNTVHTYILYEHHIGLPVHQEIILALDCWEHAFMIDFGTDKASYLTAFMKNINWDVVNKRFEDS